MFCHAVELGSVSRAAERPFVTQPVVSTRAFVAGRVGVPLFRREGRGIELNEAGHSVHAWAQELLSRRDNFAQELDELAGGPWTP